MKVLGKSIANAAELPVRVVQFGGGNFIRGFADHMIDIANEQGLFNGSIVIVKATEYGNFDAFHKQDCQYTLMLRGIEQGEAKVCTHTITSVSDAVECYKEYDKYIKLAHIDTLRFVISNTTEVGIVFDSADLFMDKPAKTFPGKLTQLLYERFIAFSGALDKGLIILPLELIDDNGSQLQNCVNKMIEHWALPESFKKWVDNSCIFANTLVDRIVTGYPKDEAQTLWNELGYRDELLDTAEPFALWVIESKKDISEELPLDKASLPVIFTDSVKPYKQRKVSILNGAHTSFVLASYLAGNDYVIESMEDSLIFDFIKKTIYEEVIPTLTLPLKDLADFANAVFERFRNPFIKHSLLSISLNSVSKWRTRCLPSFLEYMEKYKKLPQHLTFSIAALLAFYTADRLENNVLIGERNGLCYEIKDELPVLEFFRDNSKGNVEDFVLLYLKNTSFHGQDLSKIENLADTVTNYLKEIQSFGMRKAMENL